MLDIIKKTPKAGNNEITYNNDWTGTWTGKNGINNKDEFLHNREVQEKAAREYHQILWRYAKNYQDKVGKEIAGIELTKSGMIAAMHLVGHTGLKKFIDSNGKIDKEDKNKVPCSEYLKNFKYSEIDFTTKPISAQPAVAAPTLAEPQPASTPAAPTPQSAPAVEAPPLSVEPLNVPTVKYTIQEGNNLPTLAQGLGVSVEQLLALPGNQFLKERGRDGNVPLNAGEEMELYVLGNPANDLANINNFAMRSAIEAENAKLPPASQVILPPTDPLNPNFEQMSLQAAQNTVHQNKQAEDIAAIAAPVVPPIDDTKLNPVAETTGIAAPTPIVSPPTISDFTLNTTPVAAPEPPACLNAAPAPDPLIAQINDSVVPHFESQLPEMLDINNLDFGSTSV